MYVRLKIVCLLLLGAIYTEAINIDPAILAKLKNLQASEVKCQPNGPGSDVAVAVGETFRMKKGGQIFECICGLPFCRPLSQKQVQQVKEKQQKKNLKPKSRTCCKKADGSCAMPGDSWFDQKTCDSLYCEKTGHRAELKTRNKGCALKNGGCLRHGNTAKEECNEVRCENGELKVVKPGCKREDGSCSKAGDTWTDKVTCDVMKCQQKGSSAAVVSVDKGCTGNNKKCVKSGQDLTQDCTTFRCVQGSLTPSKPGCKKSDGTCARDGDSWTDRDTCKVTRCVVSGNSGQIKSESLGCKDSSGRCVKEGDSAKQKDSCDEFQCVKGQLQITKPGCKRSNGQCAKVGESWTEEACEVYKCVKTSPTKATKTDMGKGCVGPDGKCIKHGDSHTAGCATSQCRDGKLVPNKKGCPKPGGGCYKHDETVANGCSKQRCVDGKMEVSLAGCKKPDGTCAKPGDTWTDPKTCDTMECVRGADGAASAVKAGTGCQKPDGSCAAAGHTWFDKKACLEYRCVRSGKGSEKRVEAEGCKDNYGSCIKPNFEARSGCSTHRCVNGRLKIHKAGCPKRMGGCYADGEKFSDKCVEKQCENGHVTVVKGGCANPHDGGRCMDKDAVFVKKDDCTTYECQKVGHQFKMVPTASKCKNPNTGVCVSVGEDFLDESTCSQMVCTKRANKVKLEVKDTGCRDHEGKCMKNGAKSTNECESFICVDGQLKVEKQGCKKKEGGCYKQGEMFTEDCVQKECVDGEAKVVEGACYHEGPPSVCVKEGSSIENPKECNKLKCVKVGDQYELQESETDCRTSQGTCVKVGHVQIRLQNCDELRCMERPGQKPKLIKVGKGCRDSNGDCIRHQVNTSIDCSVSTCLNGQLKVIKPGCKNPSGGCYAQNEEFEEKCTRYVCKNGKIQKKRGGCVNTMDNDKCLEAGEKYRHNKDCSTYQCKQDGEKFTMVKLKAGCRSRENQCVEEAEVWEDKKRCEKYRCKRVGDSSQMELIYRDCISVYDKCYPAGSPEQFTCEVGGYEYHRCDCLKGKPPSYPEIGVKFPYPGHVNTIAREGPDLQEGICKFPFEWGGRKFGSCTMRGWDKLWCNTQYPFQTKTWGNCFQELKIETDKGKMCHFPFKYKGKWRHDCIEDTPRWCSLTEDFDKDGQKAICTSPRPALRTVMPKNNQLVAQPNCVIPFDYKGKTYYDCKRPKWRRPWCYNDPNYKTNKKWAYCEQWKMWRLWYNYHT